MSAPRTIPPDARDLQWRAANPAASVFVSANAGSGKTHVLVTRVIRLLLDGVAPEKILCVTFTKAAAANMAERVFTTLGGWVTLGDKQLDDAIRGVGLAHPDTELRRRARELFAGALETPGGLKVQTIHALCTRLLQQFPFEANVPARFSVMDDRDRTEMMERANLDVLLRAASAPDSAEGKALQVAMASAADVTFADVVREACTSRDDFLAWNEAAGSPDAAMAQLAKTLGVSRTDSLEAIDREIIDGPLLPRTKWEAIALVLDGGSKSDHSNAQRFRDALALPDASAINVYLGIFFTAEMSPRKSLTTKAIKDSRPDIARRLDDERERLTSLLDRRRAVAIFRRTQALVVIAGSVAANYRREKQDRGLLDYDDLIDKTLHLLRSTTAGWVHFKLDRGVDHVLIDEAQDTSPRQWDIVFHLIDEFASGKGARDGVRRTIFAVGDEKQSIFSFQGAAPREFDARRRELQQRFTSAKLPFELVAFKHSFRSGAAVLRSVDYVFRDEAIFRSIHAIDNGYPIHESLADAGPSLIDLWPLEENDKQDDIEGWRAALDHIPEASPEAKLAKRVSDEIRALIGGGVQTGPRGARRPLRHGDMLVLVRRRGRAFDAIIETLKRSGVPVAGADRLKLTEHIAVIDLMNLGDALLFPKDDLALAVALKSPIFGLDDDDLFKLAWNRKGSLRRALRDHAKDDTKFSGALKRLEACAQRASETPFTFFAWLLGGQGFQNGGRARILRRLGPEANDALDEFLQLALAFERRAPATLQGFMAWLRAADTEVKRDMEISRDEVRVMTVHGAKGLEAPVVFLIDTTSSPADTKRYNLLRLPVGNDAPNEASPMVWPGRKADDPPAVATARAAKETEDDDEYRRLLYVAMTRAADRLIVGGCMPGNRNNPNDNWWYRLIEKGLGSSELAMQLVPPPDGVVKRYSKDGEPEPPMVEASTVAAKARELPAWLRKNVARAAAPPKILRPSDNDEAVAAHGAGGDAHSREEARQRGILVHRLLQSLPDVPEASRGDAAANYLKRYAKEWTDAARSKLAAEVVALIVDPRFAAVFAAGSRSEVPLVGRLTLQSGDVVGVSGQIDRLVVTPKEVLIVDYKTGRQLAGDAPQAYVRQLALYRALLRKLYPDRPVRAALLWTETPVLVEISTVSMEAGLGSLLSPSMG